MTAGGQIVGVATYGRPRRRPVVAGPQPVPTVCEVCGTDQETGVCPARCLTRRRKD